MHIGVQPLLQVEERGKLVCQPDGYYPGLTASDVSVSCDCKHATVQSVTCCMTQPLSAELE